MRDIAVLLFLIACIGITLRRPWMGVLALAVFSYMNPHAFAWTFMVQAPVYLVMFLFAFLALFLSKERQPLPADWRLPVFFLLWAYFGLSTVTALDPAVSWPKLVEVSKIFLPFALTLWLINTRERLHYLILTIAGAIGLVAVKGGVFALATGFQHRVWGPTGTVFAGNNEFAIATLMAIPLLILWYRETGNRYLRIGLPVAITLAFASAVASWSRGAFLTMGVLVVVLLWNSRRRLLILPLMLVGLVTLVSVLPEGWFSRMESIQSFEEDESAMSRIHTWIVGLNYVVTDPFTGAGFNGFIPLGNKHDWHSAYVEVLAEHGFIAAALWLSLLWGSILSLTRMARDAKRHAITWGVNYALMLRASLIAYSVGSLFLGITYWDLLYHIVFIAVLARQFLYREIAAGSSARDEQGRLLRARMQRDPAGRQLADVNP